MNKLDYDEIRKAVREQYGKAAGSDTTGCGCSEGSCADESIPGAEVISKLLGYSDREVTEVPDGANMGSGCGNLQAIASIGIGEAVLDLGSGGGFDSFLAAKQVGDQGWL